MATSSTKSSSGFFSSFDPVSYRTFLHGLSDSALLEKEKSKMKAEVSGGVGVGGSVMAAIISGGITAPLVLLSGRQLYLAEKKLSLIREVMDSRGLRQRELTNGQFFRAVGPRVVSNQIGINC
jgi:hypothetical protein